MEQPLGFQDTGHPDYVCKLRRALYGLKQALRAWHDKIAQYLITIGFHMADANHSLYVQKTDAGIVIITIYVDDLIIGALEDVEHVKALLRKQFDMKDLVELRYFLGIEMICNESGIWLLQEYGLDMLMKYGMADCTQVQVYGYTDSDWVGSVSADRRSTNGYMFSFGSAAVTWSDKKQPTIALSSTEGEYRGASVAACEVAWLEMLLRDCEIVTKLEIFRPL
ncbi:hypothetical protein L7F22_023739 [Adiantum nelumboides]|nr:hypothetical protein [Adiantum nelumboides]